MQLIGQLLVVFMVGVQPHEYLWNRLAKRFASFLHLLVAMDKQRIYQLLILAGLLKQSDVLRHKVQYNNVDV